MIADAIKQAQALARKAQEATYDGRCTVTEYQKVKDQKTKITAEKETTVLEDEPCRLSYSNVSAVDQTESVAMTAQVTKLFLSPEVQIKPGSKITVNQSGVTMCYESSGVAAIYPTHQEIVLKLAERYA
nr:MAG TPA: head closure knob [Caudoviricetes sp.]